MVGCYAQIASASCYLGFERHHQATNDLRHVTYILILLKTLQLKCENPSKIHLIKVIWNNNCVNLAWSMESGYGIQFPVWGFQAKMTLTSMFGIQSQAWYSIPMLILDHKFGIGSEFPRLLSVLFILESQVWYSTPVLVLNYKLGIQ